MYLSYLIINNSNVSDRILITNYSQEENGLVIYFNKEPTSAFFNIISFVPEELKIDQIRQKSSLLKVSHKKITLPILNRIDSNEFSIIVFVDNDFFELVRQPSSWLKRKFSFDRPGGYSILGRRSIGILSDSEHNPSKLVFEGSVKLKKLSRIPNLKYEYKEIGLAMNLLRFLWRKPIQQGPIDKSYMNFLSYTLKEKLELVTSGGFSIMCQGFRDIFIHASTGVQGLKTRAIDAYNYSPQINDLISYSHSTVEIWLEAEKKWVLFDPWLGIMIKKEGKYLGAVDINLIKNYDNVEVVPLLDFIPRMVTNSVGENISNRFEPKQVKLEKFACSDLGCTPGYVEYFKNYDIRQYKVNEKDAPR
jgi:hypothetical protein